MRWVKCFNPQPRVAADVLRQSLSDLRILVSIHSRAWRLTWFGSEFRYGALCFNPQPRVAADINFERYDTAVHVSIHSRAWRLT